jgi:hypothetical protein
MSDERRSAGEGGVCRVCEGEQIRGGARRFSL